MSVYVGIDVTASAPRRRWPPRTARCLSPQADIASAGVRAAGHADGTAGQVLRTGRITTRRGVTRSAMS